MLPNRPLVLVLLVPLLVSILTLFNSALIGPMLLLDLAVVLVALADLVWVRRPEVEVRRRVDPVLSLRRESPVTLVVSNLSSRNLIVEVEQDLFEAAQASGLPLRLKLPAGQSVSAQYLLQPGRRGAFRLGNHHVRYPSPLGLWSRQLKLPAEDEVKVYPDLQALRGYDLLARQDREFALLRASKQKGGESEFSRLREYSVDDEFRAVDWKATARKQSLIVREYQIESNQNVVFMLDAGRLMLAESDGVVRFDQALNASLMLAQVAVRGGDRVGLLGFDDQIRAFVAPQPGKLATQRMIQACYDLHAKLVEADYDKAFDYLSAQVKKRSLVVFFCQVLDDAVAQTLVRRARAISRRHLCLFVMLRDDEVERLLLSQDEAADWYTRAAASEVLRWRDGLIQKLRASGALVLDTHPQKITPNLIEQYLRIKSRQLL